MVNHAETDRNICLNYIFTRIKDCQEDASLPYNSCCNKPRTHKSAALNSKTWGKEGIQSLTLWKSLYVKGWRLAFCSSFILSAPFVRQIACMWIELRLTRPPVASASFPMSAKRQSVPSKVITDIMTLQEKKNPKNNAWRPFCTQQTIQGMISITQTNYVGIARNVKLICVKESLKKFFICLFQFSSVSHQLSFTQTLARSCWEW